MLSINATFFWHTSCHAYQVRWFDEWLDAAPLKKSKWKPMADLTEYLFEDKDLTVTTHAHAGKVVRSSLGAVVVACRGQIRGEISPLKSAFAIDPEIAKSWRTRPGFDHAEAVFKGRFSHAVSFVRPSQKAFNA